ncbi:type IV toxin-antitoxin system AbiEi family antitoxin domain-containing protein [Sinomonas sp. JGH33]|uniref:Type IV toxin-antitoxin system AbiEi family antitoxin domain-containing protein n=1 Tax=Sinomonas terricola TaxID=3110330 RepID=A0ABU5TCQ2_9MICC|nr:type IV toxin-antitoxin system AbiEi family antitoxin domain-containing protein [Sinomonas sp. JGH33]MEA5457310.1 type IV toxin-antitoxin system AbiEi family antitoxin domain-containing protein [Sinomonas sp. JGH33]
MGVGKLAVLGSIAEQRWGLVTAAQARESGISPMQVSRLVASGGLMRLKQGVYRMAGSPELEHEDIIATWLALGGDHAPRSPSGAPGLVVAGVDATILHGLGDFYPGEHELIVPARKGTRLPGVRFRVRDLAPEEVTFVEALPVLTVERTVADLVETWTETSLVTDVVRDAVLDGRLVRPDRLAVYLAPLAARHGFPDGDGRAFTQWLYGQAGAQPLEAAP